MRCTRFLVVVLAMLLLPAQALAGTASVVDIDVERLGPGQSLRYLAAPGEANDLRVVGADDRHFTLHDPVGITPGPGCSAVDGATVVCTLAPDLEQLGPTLRLGDAGDRATLAVSVCAVYAGRGQDDVRLTGISSCDVRGGAGDDRLTGGDGTASLDGGHGDDQLTGGAGNDGLGGGAGSDVIRGGGGRDSVGYVDRRRPLSVSLDGRANDGERGEHDLVAPDVENVTGGSADDRITGSAAANQLTGGAGSDVIRGGAGDDRLEGGIPYLRQSRAQDRDRLYGGAGHDRLYSAERGSTLLVGGPGQDLLNGGPSDDTMRADDGEADSVDCRSGIDAAALDAHDFVGPRCERLTRRGRAAAVLASVGPVFVNTAFSSPAARIYEGCPADGPGFCRMRVRVLDGDRTLLIAITGLASGYQRGVRLPLPADLSDRLKRGELVRLEAVVTSRDRQGRQAVRRQPLILTSDLYY